MRETGYNKVRIVQLNDMLSNRSEPFCFCVIVRKGAFKMACNVESRIDSTGERVDISIKP